MTQENRANAVRRLNRRLSIHQESSSRPPTGCGGQLVNRWVINVALIIFSARNVRAGVYRAHIRAPRPDERSLRSERGMVINNKSTQNIPATQRVQTRHTSGNEFRDYVRLARSILHLTYCAFTRGISHRDILVYKEKKEWSSNMFFRKKVVKCVEYEIMESSKNLCCLVRVEWSRTFPRTRDIDLRNARTRRFLCVDW